MKRSGEFDWIARYFAPLSGKGAFGLIDDAARLEIPSGFQLVVTTDVIAEGIHFLADDPVDLIARKALRVNVSDLIAKGAQPISYTVALGVPDRWRDSEIENFASGLKHDQLEYGVELLGGDTYRSPDRLCISVTCFGIVPSGKYKSRLSARAGDLLFVSGTIGDAALGLKVAQGELKVAPEIKQACIDAYRLPRPPLAMVNIIAEYASASMDVSDGLLGDCRKLCSASCVSAQVFRTKVPVSDETAQMLSKQPDLWRSVLTGGDDYQCLCAVAPDKAAAFQTSANRAGVNVTEIGVLAEGERGKVALDMGGLDVSIGEDSFTHF